MFIRRTSLIVRDTSTAIFAACRIAKPIAAKPPIEARLVFPCQAADQHAQRPRAEIYVRGCSSRRQNGATITAMLKAMKARKCEQFPRQRRNRLDQRA